MKKRKICSFATFLLASAMALTACSGGGVAPSGPASPSSGGTNVSQAESKALTKLRIMGAVDVELWETRGKQPAWQAFEKMLADNGLEVEFEAISAEQYDSVLQTRAATGTDLPDIVSLRSLDAKSMDTTTVANLGKTGIFLDLIPLVDEHSNGSIKKVADKYFADFWGPVRTEDGKAYWMPGWNGMTHGGDKLFSSPMVPVVRYDWLQKLGLPVPTTMGELAADLKLFREKDVNGNGKQDEVMQFTPLSFEYLAPLFGLPKGHAAVDVSDDVVKSPWLMKDKLIPYLEFLQDMSSSGVLATDALDKPYEYLFQQIKANQVSCQMGFAATGQYDVDVAEHDGVYLGVVTPYNPDDYYVFAAPPDTVVSRFAVTKACKDTAAAIKFFDVCSTDEYATNYRFGVEGITYNMENGYVTPIDGLGARDTDLAGKGILATFASQIVPCLRLEQWEAQTKTLGAQIELRKPLGDKYGCGGAKIYYWGDYQEATPNDADAARYAEFYPDLKTYMDETLTKFALGQYKIEDFDQYVEKMKSMGLDELVAIKQRNHDRYIDK